MMTAFKHVHLPGRSTRVVAASVIAHLLLLAVLMHRNRIWIEPVHMPGTSHGTTMMLTYLPGSAQSAASAKLSTPHRQVRTRAIPAPVPAAPVLAAPAETLGQTPGNGADALGEGEVSIALMQFFPDPQPDLSRLPHGSRGDVVLEAIIDADGRVAQLTVKQRVGYGIDESVIATVEQWTFHPAMRDGKPVASQQEFHFHYERA